MINRDLIDTGRKKVLDVWKKHRELPFVKDIKKLFIKYGFKPMAGNHEKEITIGSKRHEGIYYRLCLDEETPKFKPQNPIMDKLFLLFRGELKDLLNCFDFHLGTSGMTLFSFYHDNFFDLGGYFCEHKEFNYLYKPPEF